jgi:hypothetical protein
MEAKIAALEEEISILKGEIKSILQEVRTAILASENPFTGTGAMTRPHSDPGDVKVVQLPAPPAPVAAASAPAPAPDYGPAHPPHGPATQPAPPPPYESVQHGSAPTAPRDEEGQPYEDVAAQMPRPEEARQAPPRRGPQSERRLVASAPRQDAPDVRALAALLTWVEETRERLDQRGYKVVLGLARYGALIDAELEQTLLTAAETVGGREPQEHTSVNDSIVALRQLEAILAPDTNVRRLSDYTRDKNESDGHYTEVRPSRRQ